MSPWAYLGAQRFYDLQNKHNFEINHYPLDISKLFSLTGGIPLRKRSEQRKAVRMMELQRWKKKLKLPLNFNPKYFPIPNTETASCMILSIKDSKIKNFLSLDLLKCVWIEEKDIGDVKTLLKVCNNLQLDGKKILEESKNYIDYYNSLPDIAAKHNIFGSPSYVLNDEVFWGQDRLDLLEEKILENC
tara:strand:+ start:1565 stop:2128 length:564 start_codon:yes stop_codon:yes gene_type:complete